MNHKIYIQTSADTNIYNYYETLISKAIIDTLQNEKIDTSCVVDVLVTDDEGIRKFNHLYRNIDKATDVLSFPMQTFLQAGCDGLDKPEFDENTGDLPLGDIIISMESAIRQAEDYGNTIEYETAYLIIHSTLHLIGYDHNDDNKEIQMHKKNKAITQRMGLTVNDK